MDDASYHLEMIAAGGWLASFHRVLMSSPIQLPTWQVLIIEDDPLVQLDIEQALAHYSQLTIVDTVDDSYLAVEAAVEHTPNLVLMDIGLPGIDGIGAIRSLA